MHRRWCACGYDPDAFWGQTPQSFHSAMMGAEERAAAEGEAQIALAHTMARFSRAKELRDLACYLPRKGAKMAGSLLDRVKSIAAATKGL